MNYRLVKVSDTLHRIDLGRSVIGWCRVDGDCWIAKAGDREGIGATASAAFRDMVSAANNATAQAAGFVNAAAMVAANNAAVRTDAEALNRLMVETGLSLRVRVRRGRRVLV